MNTRSVNRREFIKHASALAAAGTTLPTVLDAAGDVAAPLFSQATGPAAAKDLPLDLAEWSYFWLGARPAHLAKGTVVSGEQMYVESLIPAQLRHPFSIVMVHGGGGQGLDWLTTPDGRRGWAHLFVAEGYRVYVVDRPGHGRSPFHPDVDGPFGPRAGTYDNMQRQFTAPEKAPMPYGPEAKLHTQWPGTGVVGDPTTDQVAAGQGGTFIPDLNRTHAVWAERAGELLDKIGPAVIMTHSMGGPFAWIAANARPGLVVGLLPVEPAGPPFGNLRFGVAASALAYDPPIADPSELKTVEIKPGEPGRSPYLIQAEPVRKLKNLVGIPIALTTSPASYHFPYDQGTVAFLRQAGCTVEHIELEKRGITGNAHFMMMEKNNRDVLQPILEFLDKTVTPYAAQKIRSQPPAVHTSESAAMKLAAFGNFWVGGGPKQMPYGTISDAATFVQYLIPSQQRSPVPIVLTHETNGQMLHYLGNGNGAPGWAHYFVQAGYRVYLIDRPGHGRGVYHPDTLGAITPLPTYEQLLPDFQASAKGPVKQWPGSAELGDPFVDQFMASQNARPVDLALATALDARHAALLLDKIGPAVVVSHGNWGWYAANERPKHVKAVISFEGGGAPVLPPGEAPNGRGGRGAAAPESPTPTPVIMPNLRGIPMVYFTADNSGRKGGPAIVDALKASGAAAEHVFLRDRGQRGNGHYAMLENNRKAVFDLLREWIERNVRV